MKSGHKRGAYFLHKQNEFIYAYWCPTLFPYQMMFVSINSSTTGVTIGEGTTFPSGAPAVTHGF